jgi:hypothetical protein
LINNATEAPLQFPKNREMIFQLREALFANDESAFEFRKLSAASRIDLTTLHLREERHNEPSGPRDPCSKSFGFSLGLGDRRTHNFLNDD